MSALPAGPASTASALPLPLLFPLLSPPEKPCLNADISSALELPEPPAELALVQLMQKFPVGAVAGDAPAEADAAPAWLEDPDDAVPAEDPAGRWTTAVAIGPLPALTPA